MIRFTDIIANHNYTLIDGLYVFASGYTGQIDIGYSLDRCPYCEAPNITDACTRSAGWYWVMYGCRTMVAKHHSTYMLGTSAPGPLCLLESQEDVI